MSWLVAQLWLWMALSGLLGFLSTLVLSTRRVTVERVVEAPVQAPVQAPVEAVAPVAVEEAVTAGPAVREVSVDESPFPVLPGGAERPWEAEEEWSRPAKRAAFVPSSSATSASSSATAGDDWDDAAASWRDWANEATGSGGVPGSDASPSPFPAGAVDTPFRYDAPVDSPFPYAQPVEAPFPYAQPVEALPVVDHRERLEAERLAAARAEAERLEAEHLEAERLETERRAADRREAERLDAERLEAERADEVPLPLTPYGPGSAYAPFDGSAPLGFAVKGHEPTKLFHTDQSRFFSRIHADVWFDSEDSARAAGFKRWDQRLTTAHHVRHPTAG